MIRALVAAPLVNLVFIGVFYLYSHVQLYPCRADGQRLFQKYDLYLISDTQDINIECFTNYHSRDIRGQANTDRTKTVLVRLISDLSFVRYQARTKNLKGESEHACCFY